VPARLIKIKYITIRAEKVASPVTVLHRQVLDFCLSHLSTCYHVSVAVTRRCLQRLEMWANAQRDGHPAEYRWRPLFNAAVWLTPTTRLPCSNGAKDAKPVEITWGAPN